MLLGMMLMLMVVHPRLLLILLLRVMRLLPRLLLRLPPLQRPPDNVSNRVRSPRNGCY